MSRKQKYRILWVSIFLLWASLGLYKGFLYLFRNEYSGMNAINQGRIQDLLKARDSFSFVVVGNVKSSMKIFDRRIAPLLAEEKIDFVISAGNAVNSGSEVEYRILNSGLRRSGLPYILGVGMGEVEGPGTGLFYRHFGPLSFTLEAGGVSFLFMDSTGVTNWNWQMGWVEGKLQETTAARFRFVILGHPAIETEHYGEGIGTQTLSSGKIRRLQDLLAKHSVTAVFYPGTSVPDRKELNGVEYFAVGSAGGFLFDKMKDHYQYLRVDVRGSEVLFSVVEVPSGSGLTVQKIETFGYFLHSFLYISFIKFLAGLGLVGLAALRIYSHVLRQENLYRDFDLDETRITSKPVRVAFFTDNYLPYIGGVPVSIYRLTRGLLKSGSVVKIFAPSYGNNPPSDESTLVYRCRTMFFGRKMRFPVTQVFSRRLRDELLEFEPDIVHVHHPFWLGNKGRKLARKAGVPVIFTYHTRLDKYVHNIPVPGSSLKEFLAHCLIKNFANKCDAIIAPGHSTEEYLQKLGVRSPIATIPTGVDILEYSGHTPDEVRKFRRRYAHDHEILLVSVGRLALEKNIDFMIDGLFRVREMTSVPFRCILVGDGPERSYLESRIGEMGLGDCVLFTGPMEHSEVVRAYLASEIFVFASRTETQGMVLLEAMAGGCPVVAVNSSGVHEVVQNGFNGFKVTETIERWAEAVTLLLENKQLLNTFSRNSTVTAREFSVDQIVEKVLKLYHGTIKRKLNAVNHQAHRVTQKRSKSHFFT